MSYSVAYIYRLRDKMSPGMKKIAKSSKKMADKLKKDGNSISKTYEKAGRSMQSAGKKMVVAGGAIVVGAGLMAKQAMDFNKGIAELSTLMPSKTLKGVKKEFSSMMLGISSEFGQNAEIVVNSAYQAVSAGIAPQRKAVKDFLQIAGNAATGGVTTMETAVNAITGVTNAYGLEIVSATRASDLMFTAIVGGRTTFEELSASLYNVVPTAAAVGVSFGEVAASLAAITKQGTPTAQATVQVRQMIAELAKGNTKVAKTFKNISGKSFPEFIENGGTLQGALNMVNKEAVRTGKGTLDMFDSIMAGQGAMQLSGKNADKYTEALEANKKSMGATARAAEKMKKSASFKWNQAVQGVKNMAIQLGQVLLPFVIKIATKLSKMTSWVTKLVKKYPKFSAGVVLVTTAIGALLLVGGTLLVMFGSLAVSLAAMPIALGIVSVGWAGVTGAFSTFVTATWVFFTTNPIGWIVLAVAGIIGAFVLLYKNWDVVSSFITRTVKSITSFIWKWRGVIMLFLPVLIPIFMIWKKIKKEFGSFGGMITVIGGKFKEFGSWMGTYWGGVWDDMKLGFDDFMINLAEKIEFAKGWIANLFSGKLGWIMEKIATLNAGVIAQTGTDFNMNDNRVAENFQTSSQSIAGMGFAQLQQSRQSVDVRTQNDVGGTLKIEVDSKGNATKKGSTQKGNLGFQV